MVLKTPNADRIGSLSHYSLWIMILMLTGILQLTHQVPEWRYDRVLIENGHYWLLITGNFVHSNWMHWALNMAGLVIVAVFFNAYLTWRYWLGAIMVSSILVGTGLLIRNPEVAYYVGFSGVLHGLFILGAVCECQRYFRSGLVLIILLAGKLAWESLYGALPGSETITSGRIATEAHLYGAIGGVVSMLIVFRRPLLNKLVKIKNR